MQIVLIAFFLLLCASAVIGSGFSHKKTYTRHLALGRLIKDYIDNFSSKSFVSIEIPNKNYSENFDVFPFSSRYANTSEKLTEKSSSISVIKRLQKKYDSSMTRYVAAIYRIFNANLDVMNTSYSLFFDAYTSFMKRAFNKFTGIFANSYIPLLLEGKTQEILTLDRQNILDFRNEINNAMLEIFSNDLVRKANEIYQKEMYKQFSNEDFIRDFFNNFGKSSYNNNSYSNQNIEADEISKAYKVLEVSPESTNDEIKKSYRKLSKKYHPDVNSSDDAQKKMMVINAAYDLLKKNRNIE